MNERTAPVPDILGRRRILLVASGVALLLSGWAMVIEIVPMALLLLSRHVFYSSVLTISTILATTLLLMALPFGVAAWVLGLLRATRDRQWGWSIVILLLGSLGTLLYETFGIRYTPSAWGSRHQVRAPPYWRMH
jgi:hypothetical protein